MAHATSKPTGPDNTAVRTALWRALHVLADAPPHVFEDSVGLALVAPDEDWRRRGDMSPFTRPLRASIVARARFVEDFVEQGSARGISQYVMLGAGLDTFAAPLHARQGLGGSKNPPRLRGEPGVGPDWPVFPSGARKTGH